MNDLKNQFVSYYFYIDVKKNLKIVISCWCLGQQFQLEMAKTTDWRFRKQKG